MRTISISVLVLFVLLLAAGCTHTVNVALRPNYQEGINSKNALSAVQPALKFNKGKFEDKRANTTVLATFKQSMHTYNLYEERPVDEALFEGLQILMQNSGHIWNEKDPGDVQIDMQLLNVQATRNAGMVMVGATSGIQMKLDFINAKTNEVLYTQIYSGSDERERALVGLMDMVTESLDASIVKCIESVGSDEGLVRALKKAR